MAQPRILIVGGSTRAAADSVRRAGCQPICADLFADFDLRKTAEVVPVREYPRSLPEDLIHVRADGWFYCGALENNPQLIERLISVLTTSGPLLGTFPEALKLVRNPGWLAKTLQSAEIPFLEVRGQTSPPEADGSWLQKPIASAGGRMIRVWDQSAARSPNFEPHYFQRRVSGDGISGLLRIENDIVEWLGASRELNRSDLSRSPTPFSYCGSAGPYQRCAASVDFPSGLSKNGPEETEIQPRSIQIANVLVQNVSGLQGLIGLDFRFDGKDLWLVEVNPRYTASVEVLELGTNRSFLNLQLNSQTVGRQLSEPSNSRLIAKQILYASETIKVPDLSHYWVGEDPWKIPCVADIPLPNSNVEAGWPICTVLAQGSTWMNVESTLNERLEEVKRLLRDQ